jgi:hypothetical protein
MKPQTRWVIVLTAALVLSASAGQKSANTLAEIYAGGSVRFIPELTIDETTLPKEVFFESAVDIRCDPGGNVFVCDFRAHNVKKFDSSGKFLKTIGREGQGPGEFSWPFALAVTADRLFVYDMRNNRVCALSPEGEFIKSVPVLTGEGRPRKMNSLPNGDLVVGMVKTDFREMEKPQNYSVEIYSPDLEHKRTIFTQEVMENKYMRLEQGLANIPQPFSPFVHWDVLKDGRIVIAYAKNYEIFVFDAEKGKIGSFSRAYEPVKVTKKDEEQFFAGMSYTADGGTVRQGAPDHIVKNTEFPKHKPPFFNLLADPEGNILVFTHRSNKEEEWKYFEAFTPEGKYLGGVQVTGKDTLFQLASVGSGAFWGRAVNEEGVSRVVKYRISD